MPATNQFISSSRELAVGDSHVGGGATVNSKINFDLLALGGRAAQTIWNEISPRHRATRLTKLRHQLVAQASGLARSIAAIRHCSTAEALATELHPLADALQFLEGNLAKLLRPRRLGRHGRPVWLAGVQTEIQRVPHGLVLVIGPGNYPLLLTAIPALQAIAAGNAVWIKPAPGCAPLLGQFRELVVGAGLPSDLLTILPDDVAADRSAIATGPDKLIFTGSAETGGQILAQLAPRLTPATMELSGCDAAFIREDADLDLAARALAFGITLNRGATCIAPRRVFVPGRHLIALGQKLTAELTRRASLELSTVGARWLPNLQSALADGAILIHGKIRPGAVTGPLVLTHARAEMRLLREDTFAPVMSLVPVMSDEEALTANARCPYALGASVFSKHATSARALAGRIRAGSVIINDLIAPTADPRVPFGGVGQSGFGVTRGAEGLLEMTFPKVIALNGSSRRWHYQHLGESDAPLMTALLELTHAPSLGQKFRALHRVIRFARGRKSGTDQAPEIQRDQTFPTT
jgi:acyl-CoA reductase-like NAD-dependent aldehyde dehydrogenase